MDSQLTFEAHINHLCKTFYHLRNISKLHPILSQMPKSCLMPLSPPDWTTVTYFSLGSLARVCRDLHPKVERVHPNLTPKINPQNTTHSLRSTHSHLLIPRTRLRTMGDWAFCAPARHLWNALPDTFRASQSTDCFKKGVKTFPFSNSGPSSLWTAPCHGGEACVL